MVTILLREIYRNRKTGTHWQIFDRKTYGSHAGGKLQHATLHPIPTVRVNYQKDFVCNNTYSLSFELAWLLWALCVTRYWGEGYKEQMEC